MQRHSAAHVYVTRFRRVVSGSWAQPSRRIGRSEEHGKQVDPVRLPTHRSQRVLETYCSRFRETLAQRGIATRIMRVIRECWDASNTLGHRLGSRSVPPEGR